MQRLELVAWVQVWAESHGHVEPVYITAGEFPVIALLTSAVIPLQLTYHLCKYGGTFRYSGRESLQQA